MHRGAKLFGVVRDGRGPLPRPPSRHVSGKMRDALGLEDPSHLSFSEAQVVVVLPAAHVRD